jgi:hypothetical protein
MSPLSQTVMPKDNEAPLPTSSPPVPKFKEASLPSSPKEKRSFYITIVTCQGYALAGPRPPGIRSTTVISLQHNPPGIRPVQPKYPFRPNEQVL